MCLILFAYRAHPDYPLVLAANRDEWFDRRTATAAFWDDHPAVLAGRDLEHGGTWLGMTRRGRFAALTNYRDPGANRDDAPSRGHIVREFLTGRAAPSGYSAALATDGARYNGYNFLGGTLEELAYYSNRLGPASAVAPGVHGLSNHLLDTDWPKVVRGRARLAALVETGPLTLDGLFAVVADRGVADATDLPDTGVPPQWERALSAAHILAHARSGEDGMERHYGTRCATAILVDTSGRVQFGERSFDLAGSITTVARESFALAAG